VKIVHTVFIVSVLTTLAACTATDDSTGNTVATSQANPDNDNRRGRDNDNNNNDNNLLDNRLAALIAADNLSGNPTAGLDIPSIDDPVSQLGMKLFYSKSLGGETDSACVTCHHPVLGGSDGLSLGVGVEAIQEDLLGPGRQHISGEFTVPRNAPTTFNSALYRNSLFWDSRVTQLDGGIRTPDSDFATPDPSAGNTLLEAQARFPVTSIEEMRTDRFEAGASNDAVRNHLAARIGGYDGGFSAQDELAINNWLIEFQTAFGSSEPAESLINYDNIATALASYEASQLFIDNPWSRYLAGELDAISDDAKRGAILFFTPKQNGGGHCSQCHSGDLFSDESHHVVAFPQIGHGKGDGTTGDDDFGLERESGDRNDRYRFRTPSLLNVSETAPYGHTGAYRTLRDVVSHYDRPQNARDFFNDNDWCQNISLNNGESCTAQFPNARRNTANALDEIDNRRGGETIEGINLNNNEINQIVEFLETLTDPCTQSRDCLAPWIPAATGGPDGNQLNGVNRNGDPL
jgi:cytochrome c peroxidase